MNGIKPRMLIQRIIKNKGYISFFIPLFIKPVFSFISPVNLTKIKEVKNLEDEGINFFSEEKKNTIDVRANRTVIEKDDSTNGRAPIFTLNILKKEAI